MKNQPKCLCVCHDDPLKKQAGYAHDTKCCERMNGFVKADWEKDFALDAVAHAQGRCSYSSMALCSAEEQRIKLLIRELLATQAKASQERVIEKIEKLRKQNKEVAPADREEEIDERAYEAALGDVLSSLQDPTN